MFRTQKKSNRNRKRNENSIVTERSEWNERNQTNRNWTLAQHLFVLCNDTNDTHNDNVNDNGNSGYICFSDNLPLAIVFYSTYFVQHVPNLATVPALLSSSVLSRSHCCLNWKCIFYFAQNLNVFLFVRALCSLKEPHQLHAYNDSPAIYYGIKVIKFIWQWPTVAASVSPFLVYSCGPLIVWGKLPKLEIRDAQWHSRKDNSTEEKSQFSFTREQS